MGASYTPRQVAAISVGCALGGLLVAFAIAAFAFFQHRKRKAKSGSTPVSTGPPENFLTDVVSNHPANHMFSAEEGIPKPHVEHVEDIARRLRLPQKSSAELSFFALILMDHIAEHVERFYNHTQEDSIKVADLSTGLDSDDLSQLLSEPKTRKDVIRRYLAQQILPSISPICEPELALLPLEFVRLLRTVSFQERDDNSTFERDLPRWLAMWRHLNNTLFCFRRLLDSHYSPTKEQTEQRKSVSRRIAQSIDRVIQANPGKDKTEARFQHLRSLVEDAARLAIYIFAQIDVFELQWTPTDPSEKRLVIYPAVTQRGFANDGSLKNPVVVVGAEISGKEPKLANPHELPAYLKYVDGDDGEPHLVRRSRSSLDHQRAVQR